MLKEVQGTEATCRRGSIVPKDGAESSKGTRREEEALMRQQIISWKMGSVERHCEDKSPFDRCSRCRHLNPKASSARNGEITAKRGRLTTARGRQFPTVRPSEPRSKVSSTAQRKAGRPRWGPIIEAGVLAVSVWCHLQQGKGSAALVIIAILLSGAKRIVRRAWRGKRAKHAWNGGLPQSVGDVKVEARVARSKTLKCRAAVLSNVTWAFVGMSALTWTVGRGEGWGMHLEYTNVAEENGTEGKSRVGEGLLEAEAILLEACALDQMDGAGAGEKKDTVEKWWGMHYGEIEKRGGIGDGSGGAYNCVQIRCDSIEADKKELPAAEEEFSMAVKCGGAKNVNPQLICWKTMEEQFAQQEASEAKERYARMEGKYKRGQEATKSRRTRASTEKEEISKAGTVAVRGGMATLMRMQSAKQRRSTKRGRYTGERVGEAKNPGPYSIGGASGSGGGGIEMAGVVDTSRKGEQAGQDTSEEVALKVTRGKGRELDLEDCWEQDQWIEDCEREGLLLDGVGAGLRGGHADGAEWHGLLEAEADFQEACALDQMDGAGASEVEDIGEKWWGMHFGEIGKGGRFGGGSGGAYNCLQERCDNIVTDEREMPAVQEEISMAEECGGAKIGSPQLVCWKTVEVQMAQQAAQEAKERYARLEGKYKSAQQTSKSRTANAPTEKEVVNRAWAAAARGGMAT